MIKACHIRLTMKNDLIQAQLLLYHSTICSKGVSEDFTYNDLAMHEQIGIGFFIENNGFI